MEDWSRSEPGATGTGATSQPEPSALLKHAFRFISSAHKFTDEGKLVEASSVLNLLPQIISDLGPEESKQVSDAFAQIEVAVSQRLEQRAHKTRTPHVAASDPVVEQDVRAPAAARGSRARDGTNGSERCSVIVRGSGVSPGCLHVPRLSVRACMLCAVARVCL